MNVKEATKALWQYLCDTFDMEEIAEGFKTIEGFEYEPQMITNELIDGLSEDVTKSLLFDIGYVAVEELFGGDWGTYNDVLDSFDFSQEVLDLLNF